MGRLQVGQAMNSHFAERVPVGTLMRSGRHDYELAADRMWERIENRAYRYGLADFTWAQCTVSTFPNGMTELVTPQETVQQYKWRFREHALAAAVTNGVSYGASEDALRDMGAGVEHFTLGAGLAVRNPETYRRTLPAGSMVYVGDPQHINQFAVWSKGQNGQWYRLLGPSSLRQPGDGRDKHVVYSYGDSRAVPDWVKAEGTAEDERLIADFQATAWRRGWELKRAQSWCGTYENVMAQFGLTRDVVRRINGVAPGQRVSSEAAGALPVGTLLGWQSQNNPSERVLFVRTNTATNVARTVRVGGTPESSMRNYHSSMILISSPEEHNPGWASVCELPVSSDWRSLIPAGSLFTNSVGGRFEYRIVAGEHANQVTDPDPTQRRWGLNDFGADGVLYFSTLEGVNL